MTSEAECIRALREAADRLGESPTKAQYEALGLRPASATVVRTFGGWNAAKEAAGLETYEQHGSGGSDVLPKPGNVELPDGLHWEELNPQQRWYYKNRKRRIVVKRRRKQKLRRWFHDRKRDEYSCQRCGEDHPACLDFHHVGEKDRGVAEMVNFGHSKESIQEETDRCVVLCANCHRKEHYEAPDPTAPSSSQN